MKIGVVFPQTEIGADPVAVRDYAQAAEDLGFTHLVAYDHVVGAHPERPDGRPWRGPYTHQSLFHEPLVLFAYLGAITRTLEFASGIIILPQRQAVLVAKQAAEVDVLTGGRLRLGVAVGWNPVEYEALGETWENRGRRIVEQIAVMRALWTQEVVDFHGRWHHITKAGILPLPVQRPIPVWMGGMSEPVLKRVARLADGWFPQFRPGDAARQTLERLREMILAAGRKPEDVGIEGRLGVANATPDDWAKGVEAWRELGATHLSVNTMAAGFASPREHIEALRRFREAVG
ncbi:MAG TPA: LLM class F420-dependent oxidoreductase [Dehalococcoidia bacterium]|nr:LLM class F420-dependent oxidoreductase [Dehalococcoidia bacterium]